VVHEKWPIRGNESADTVNLLARLTMPFYSSSSGPLADFLRAYEALPHYNTEVEAKALLADVERTYLACRAAGASEGLIEEAMDLAYALVNRYLSRQTSSPI
jgi:hypothetical protein